MFDFACFVCFGRLVVVVWLIASLFDIVLVLNWCVVCFRWLWFQGWLFAACCFCCLFVLCLLACAGC